MLAAVTADDGRFERLQNYLLGGRKRAAPPSAVPNELAKSARLPTTPGQTPPGPPGKIPTSSQRPYQQTNTCIPYSRLMYTSMHDPTAPRDVQRGDVVMTYKHRNPIGAGPMRASKCAGVPQVNAILARNATNEQGLLDLRARTTRERVKAARVRHYTDLKKSAEDDVFHLAAQRARNDAQLVARRADLLIYTQRLDAANAFDPAVDIPNPSYADYDFDCDAEAVPLVADWALDGVLRTIDDDALDVDTARDARDDGVLFNVAVKGPTPIRNSSWGVQTSADQHLLPRNSWTPQFVDERPLMRDDVLLVLVAVNVGTPLQSRFSFYWKLGAGRQIYAMLTRDGEMPDYDQREPQRRPGTPLEKGLRPDEVIRACKVYGVGTIMDTRSVAREGNDRQMTINVAVKTYHRRAFVARYMRPAPPTEEELEERIDELVEEAAEEDGPVAEEGYESDVDESGIDRVGAEMLARAEKRLGRDEANREKRVRAQKRSKGDKDAWIRQIERAEKQRPKRQDKRALEAIRAQNRWLKEQEQRAEMEEDAPLADNLAQRWRGQLQNEFVDGETALHRELFHSMLALHRAWGQYTAQRRVGGSAAA